MVVRIIKIVVFARGADFGVSFILLGAWLRRGKSSAPHQVADP